MPSATTASAPTMFTHVLPKLRVKRLTPNATLPQRGSSKAAGYDLFSAYDTVIPARGKALVQTDISISIPDDCYARVAPRSGLAWKHHLDTGAGVIDADYRGNVGVVMFNHAETEFADDNGLIRGNTVKKGDRIAQLILEKIYMLDIEMWRIWRKLSEGLVVLARRVDSSPSNKTKHSGMTSYDRM